MNLDPGSLEQALARHGIELPPEQRQLIDRYCQLLWRKNLNLNLTRHTDFEKFVSRDVVDCWQLAQHLSAGEKVLDIGSGGGVPGIPLAIVKPQLQIVLSECIGKKADALKEFVQQLGLPLAVHRDRAESLIQRNRFDTLIGRAIGPLAKVLKWLQPHWGTFGRLLLIKGPNWLAERGEARHLGLLHDLNLRKLAEYPMPGRTTSSVILAIFPKREGDSPEPEDGL